MQFHNWKNLIDRGTVFVALHRLEKHSENFFFFLGFFSKLLHSSKAENLAGFGGIDAGGSKFAYRF